MTKIVIFEEVGRNLGGHVMWQTSNGTWSSKNGDKSVWTGITNIRGFYQKEFNRTEISKNPKFFFVPNK